MVTSILVLLMTPELVPFCGGLVNRRHTNNMLLTVLMMRGSAAILWITVGHSLSSSGDHWGMVGNLNNTSMIRVPIDVITRTDIPISDYAMSMTVFAITIPVIFCGPAIGHRRSNFLIMPTICWSIFVYYLLAYMVWALHGPSARPGTVDFADGLAAHVNVGITASIFPA